MKKNSFYDLNEKQFTEVGDAIEQGNYLKLVHNAVVGGEDEATADIARMSLDLADLTDGVSLTTTDLRLPLHLRAFVDAVIGATAGSSEFVEVTDKDLAKRMGRSTRTVQNDRKQFRAWKDHSSLIQVRDHWRDPDTGESHAHAYRCHVSGLAVDTAIEARLSPEYAKDRSMALRKAAHVVTKEAANYPVRPPKMRKKPSDLELLRRNLRSAANSLKKAEAQRPMVRNPDFDELFELMKDVEDQMTAVRAAYGMPQISTQELRIRSMEIGGSEPSDVSAPEPWVEAEKQGGSGNRLPPGIGQQNQQVSSFPPDEVKFSEPPELTAAWAAQAERAEREWARLENRLRSPSEGVQP
jgi:hypothetical protein